MALAKARIKIVIPIKRMAMSASCLVLTKSMIKRVTAVIAT